MNNNKNRQNEGQAQGCIDFLHLTDGEWKPSESERFAWGSMQQRQESDLDSSSSGPAHSLINICFFMHFLAIIYEKKEHCSGPGLIRSQS